ncbi:MAG: hypothetical protein WBV18_02440 [Methyloceanibacter sp.]|jgi:hypothetical protein|uniref:hypothetical protein n=1 Tax=Methyloceanibacter sp. TaxID=1965321 RepID=UPI003C5134BE
MLNATQLERQHDADPLSDELHLAQFSICYTSRSGSVLAAFGRSWFGQANDGTTRCAFSEPGPGGTTLGQSAPNPDRYLGLHAPFFSPLRLREDGRI